MGPADLLLRLATAAILGSMIGLERQRLDKAAGLRTHMLVSVGSALIMIVSAYGFGQVVDPGRVVLDPSRVAAQVVSGIGFLGAGSIVVRGQSVHGLTTAASVWAVSAIGLAAGGALYLAATTGTVIMLVDPGDHQAAGRSIARARPRRATPAEYHDCRAVRDGGHRAPIPRRRRGSPRLPHPRRRGGRRARDHVHLRCGTGVRGLAAGRRPQGPRGGTRGPCRPPVISSRGSSPTCPPWRRSPATLDRRMIALQPPLLEHADAVPGLAGAIAIEARLVIVADRVLARA